MKRRFSYFMFAFAMVMLVACSNDSSADAGEEGDYEDQPDMSDMPNESGCYYFDGEEQCDFEMSSNNFEASSSSENLSSSSENLDDSFFTSDYGKLIDPRDGKSYKTVKIGNLIWMAQNLNYSRNGYGVCPDVSGFNCSVNGRLYPWYEAQKVCPDGWRLPTEDDTHMLYKNLHPKDDFWNDDEFIEVFSFTSVGMIATDGSYHYDSYIWLYDDNYEGTLVPIMRTDYRYSFIEKERTLWKLSVRCVIEDSSEINSSTSARYDYFTDSRDLQVYKKVAIGGQVWMAENLKYNMLGSYCYGNNSDSCDVNGRLYTGRAAKEACPDGWHLPSLDEYNELLQNLGEDSKVRSKMLRSTSWFGGNDNFGFSALPSGYYQINTKKFYNLDYYAYFWTSTERDTELEVDVYYALGVSYFGVTIGDQNGYYAYSVRCIQDTAAVENSSSSQESLMAEVQPSGY